MKISKSTLFSIMFFWLGFSIAHWGKLTFDTLGYWIIILPTIVLAAMIEDKSSQN
jgi:hypothetical protein